MNNVVKSGESVFRDIGIGIKITAKGVCTNSASGRHALIFPCEFFSARIA